MKATATSDDRAIRKAFETAMTTLYANFSTETMCDSWPIFQAGVAHGIAEHYFEKTLQCIADRKVVWMTEDNEMAAFEQWMRIMTFKDTRGTLNRPDRGISWSAFQAGIEYLRREEEKCKTTEQTNPNRK